MARIDDLVEQVGDDGLRTSLQQAVADLRRRKRFGLVFEEHVPETTLLADEVGLKVGRDVIVRTESTNSRYTVTGIEATKRGLRQDRAGDLSKPE